MSKLQILKTSQPFSSLPPPPPPPLLLLLLPPSSSSSSSPFLLFPLFLHLAQACRPVQSGSGRDWSGRFLRRLRPSPTRPLHVSRTERLLGAVLPGTRSLLRRTFLAAPTKAAAAAPWLRATVSADPGNTESWNAHTRPGVMAHQCNGVSWVAQNRAFWVCGSLVYLKNDLQAKMMTKLSYSWARPIKIAYPKSKSLYGKL